MRQFSRVEFGFQVYLVEGGEAFGAVRDYMLGANALVAYVENAGDFVVPLEAAQPAARYLRLDNPDGLRRPSGMQGRCWLAQKTGGER
jgi:hypothetical protein